MTEIDQVDLPIGVFDSGLGGLAVLKELLVRMPYESYLYLGDTDRQPFGVRTSEEVRKIVLEIGAFLIERGVKAIVIACNTASVAGAEALRDRFPHVPVLEMIGPGAQAAIKGGPVRRVGVWGTTLTVERRAYTQRLESLAPEVAVHEQDCSDLLRLAEKGQTEDRDLLLSLARGYFEPLARMRVDSLILGCTDLTSVRDVVDETVGRDVAVIDPASTVAEATFQILEERRALREGPSRHPDLTFLITGSNERSFANLAARFLGLPSVEVSRIPVLAVQAGLNRIEPGSRPERQQE